MAAAQKLQPRDQRGLRLQRQRTPPTGGEKLPAAPSDSRAKQHGRDGCGREGYLGGTALNHRHLTLTPAAASVGAATGAERAG